MSEPLKLWVPPAVLFAAPLPHPLSAGLESKMIYIEVRHDSVDGISDRSAREILKYAAKVLRRAMFNEISELAATLSLSPSERQSITDRMRAELESGPVYYIEYLREGSFDLKSTAAAFGLFILASTAGETVKDGWKETEIYQSIIEYIKDLRDDVHSEQIKLVCLTTRTDWGRFYVQNVDVIKESDGRRVVIYLSTYSEMGPRFEGKINEDFVLSECNSALERLRSQEE